MNAAIARARPNLPSIPCYSLHLKMLLQYSSSLFSSVALFLIFSFHATTFATPIETSWLPDISPNLLDKRMPPSRSAQLQRKCSTIFGQPTLAACRAAVNLMPQDDNLQNAVNRQFFNLGQDLSNQLPNQFVPRIYTAGGKGHYLKWELSTTHANRRPLI